MDRKKWNKIWLNLFRNILFFLLQILLNFRRSRFVLTVAVGSTNKQTQAHKYTHIEEHLRSFMWSVQQGSRGKGENLLALYTQARYTWISSTQSRTNTHAHTHSSYMIITGDVLLLSYFYCVLYEVYCITFLLLLPNQVQFWPLVKDFPNYTRLPTLGRQR